MKERELEDIKNEILSIAGKLDNGSGVSFEKIREEIKTGNELFEEAVDSLIDEGKITEENQIISVIEKKPEEKPAKPDFYNLGMLTKVLANLLLFFVFVYLNVFAGVAAGILILFLNRKALANFFKSIF